MRNAVWRLCSNRNKNSNNNNNNIKRSCNIIINSNSKRNTLKGIIGLSSSSSNLLEELHNRFRRHDGLSATRKSVLLRDWQYFSAMKKETAMGDYSYTSSSLYIERNTIDNNNNKKGEELYRVLRIVSEFIASTGTCSDPTFPLQDGYTDLSSVNGIRRATLVLHYTETILLLSNDHMADIVALTFGHHHHHYQNSINTELTLEDEAQSYFNTRCPLGLMNERDTMTTATVEEEKEDNDEYEAESDRAPLTSLETVSLLRWCTWHVRTALNGINKDELTSMDSFRAIVRLVSRFLTVLLDGGLQRGAVENIMDENELSHMAYTVMDELLKLLNTKATSVLQNTNTTSTSTSIDNDVDNISSSSSSSNTIKEDKNISDINRWTDFQIHEDAQQALLCTQREHWERALSLLIRTRHWNESLVNKKNINDTDDAIDNNNKCKGVKNTIFHYETLRTLIEAPRPVLQTLQYILAQHGQWSVCMELWQETVRRRSLLETISLSPSPSSISSSLSSSVQQVLSPFAALHNPFNIDNIVTALAFVNAKPSKTVIKSSGDSLELPARLLRLLLYLGIVPNRALSPAEFAAILKQSFGLKLGRGGVAGILSPAYVWRLAASHPHRARATLCLMCFHIVVRNDLTHTLELEDLYVVTCISRQFLQEQYRAAKVTSSSVMMRHKEKEDGKQKNLEEDIVKSSSSNSSSNINDDNTDDYEKNMFGPLPVYFAPATRRTTTTTETHIVAITDAFLSIQQSMFPIPAENDTNKPTHITYNPSRPGRSTVLLSLVSHELMTLLTMAPYGRALGRTWRAALAALPHNTHHSNDLHHYYNRYPHSSSSSSYYSYSYYDYDCDYNDMNHCYSDRTVRPSRSVADPLVRLAPQLSALAVRRIVHSPLGRQLTWEQCLLLLPCTPWGSRAQRHLLRRVVLEGGGNWNWSENGNGNVAALRGIMQGNGILPPRLLRDAPTLAADMRMVAILTEHDWRRALAIYTESGERVQQACAAHVARLVISAGVWYTPVLESTRGVAVSAVSSSSSTTTTTSSHSSSSSSSSSNAREYEVSRNGQTLTLLFRVALRAVGGDRVAEEMLRGSLLRGRWAAGLAFHQFLQQEQPEILRSNSKMEMYVALLCKGLLSQTAMARAIAEVSRSARGAAWKEACETFMQYMTKSDSSNDIHNKSKNEDIVTVKQIQEEGEEKKISMGLSHSWSSLFPVRVPAQLSHFAHTVRYSMLCSEFWEQALQFFSVHSLPLPLHHQLQLQRITGEEILVNMESSKEKEEKVTKSTTTPKESEGENGREITNSPSPLSFSLVQIALQEKLHRTKAPNAKTSAAAVEQTLRVLQERGQWEQAMLVYEHALANRCFPHTAGSIVVGACLPSWEASLYCFTHLSGRMRPDAMTTALALQACARGRQWMLALRILKQSVLTTAVAAPRVIDYAVRAALHSGAWQAALGVARQYRNSSSCSTSSPLLANTIMYVFVVSKCWDDAVGFFYECVMRGMRPLDESLTMAITASEAVSVEYRDAARVVGVIASALEDFFHVHGVVQQHVLVVYREISSKPDAGVDSHLTLVSFASSVSSGSSSSNISENITDKNVLQTT